MKNHKISKLLNNSPVSKFVRRKWLKWLEVNDLTGSKYYDNKNIRFNTSMLRSYLCDKSDACIIVKGTIDLSAVASNKNDKAKRDVVFKNNAPFRLCMSKINNILIDNAEGLNIIMPMYNLLEYNNNYSVTSGRC